jgi:hypothetical protein
MLVSGLGRDWSGVRSESSRQKFLGSSVGCVSVHTARPVSMVCARYLTEIDTRLDE